MCQRLNKRRFKRAESRQVRNVASLLAQALNVGLLLLDRVFGDTALLTCLLSFLVKNKLSGLTSKASESLRMVDTCGSA
jgi:hypothetical protein